jgi:hypothetical protein
MTSTFTKCNGTGQNTLFVLSLAKSLFKNQYKIVFIELKKQWNNY